MGSKSRLEQIFWATWTSLAQNWAHGIVEVSEESASVSACDKHSGCDEAGHSGS